MVGFFSVFFNSSGLSMFFLFVFQQVSSKPLNMLQSDDIQLKMEEFGDLSALLSVATPNAKLIAYTDELNTPIFGKYPPPNRKFTPPCFG